MEALDILPDLAQKLAKLLEGSSTYVRLDTALPKSGQMLSRWGIIRNVDIDTVKMATV